MEERTMDEFLSSIVEFTDMIEKSQLETNNMEVILLIYNELWEIWSLLEYADEGADEKDPARGKYLKLEKAIHKAAVTIVDNVFRTAYRGGRKPLFERCSYCKDFGSPKESGVKIISSISESIEEFKGQLKGSSSYYSRQESFNLLDLIRSSVDFDEAEEDLTTVVGLKQDMESLKAQLRGDSHFRVISVLGIKGIGKTTLVRKIYKSRFVEVNFQSKAWVCVSGIDHDSSEIWEDIHTKILKFSPDKMYPCLIVIDGLHDFQFWSQLQSSLQGALGNRIFESGSRIILTTRDVNIASPADYTHRSKVLSKEESWKLFKTVFRAPWKLSNASGEDTKESPIPLPQELDALGQEMVGKCGGIPYIIRELANLLSTVNADHVEWSCVLHGTDTHLSSDQHPWFNLSSFVDHILPLHVKPFLHFFPIETEFPLRRFIRSLSGECLWQQSIYELFDNEEDAAMRLLLPDLEALNLVQAMKVNSIGITKTYCIPPDPLVQILKADDDSTKPWIHGLADDCNARNSLSRCIHNPTNSAEELKPYKTLHSFWCFNFTGGYKPGQEVGSFLKRCINSNYMWLLRVLDLEGVYKPSLPEAIGELIYLQYLGLRWTYLDILPSSVKNLRNLQTLDTKHTDIANYPTIQHMDKLKHLYLNERHPIEFVTQLSHLSNLQTLSGVILDDSSPVKDGLDKLTNLTKLRITLRLNQQQVLDAFSHWIMKMVKIQTLKITSKDLRMLKITSTSEGHKFKQLSRVYLLGQLGILSDYNFGFGLTTLTLSLTKLQTDPMPKLGQLPGLRLLRLFSNSFIGDSMRCLQKSFPRLQVLKIWKLEKLKQWTVDYSAFPKLEELEIRSCKNLKMLPDHVPISLCELKLTAMPKEFTSDVMGKDCEKVAHVSSFLIEHWLDYNISVELYTGWNRVLSQERLEKLFGIHSLFAVDLTELTLSETKLGQDPMLLLEKLPQLMVLVLSFKSFTGKHMVCKEGGFKELQKLTIQELEELEELNVEDGAMTKIQELEIRSCRNLKVLPQVLGTIKKLKLAKMPKDFTEKYRADKRVIIED